MGTYAEPAPFVVAGVGAFAVAALYVGWARQHWQGPGSRAVLALAVAGAAVAGVAAGLAVQEEGAMYQVVCPEGDPDGLHCTVEARMAAPALWMLILGAAVGALLFAAHHVPWRPGTPWLMLSLALAAAAVAFSGAQTRSLWLGLWVAWLILLPGAVRAQWRVIPA